MRTTKPQLDVPTVHIQARDRAKALPSDSLTLYETTPAAAVDLLRLAANLPSVWSRLIDAGLESDDPETKEAAKRFRKSASQLARAG